MKFFNQKLVFTSLSFIFLTLLVACGGGGGGGGGEENQKPIISVQDQTVSEGQQVSIQASIQDPDGSIVLINWAQVSGINVPLSGSSTATLAFTAPQVTEPSVLVFAVTATDDKGGSTTASVTVLVENNLESLTIRGKVTDGPIAFATVDVSVAGTVFSTVADQNGDYSVELSIDDSLVESLVTIEAAGVGAQEQVKLVSVLDSFEQLALKAGDDTLDFDEFTGVNVTHLSTARYALLVKANNGFQIEDANELYALMKGYNEGLVLDYATVIKLVIDYSSENTAFSLPNTAANTLEFALDHDAVSEFYRVSLRDYPNLVDAVKELIQEDSLLFANNFDMSQVPDSYYSFNADRFEINTNLTGFYTDTRGSAPFVVSRNAGELVFTFPGSNDLVYQTYEEYFDSIGRTVQVEEIVSRKIFKWLNQGTELDEVLQTTVIKRHFPNGELPDEDDYRRLAWVQTFVKSAGVIDAATVLGLNTTYSMPVPNMNNQVLNPKVDGVEVEEMATNMMFTGNLASGGNVTIESRTIQGDGSYVSDNNTVANWQITSEGHLAITGSNSWDFVILDLDDEGFPLVNVSASGDNEVSYSGRVIPFKAENWTENNIVGVYDLGVGFGEPNGYFWIELNSDGTSTTVSTRDLDQNGQLESNEFWIAPGFWQLRFDGVLEVRRYRNNAANGNGGGYCTPAVFEPADSDDCVLYHKREWNLSHISDTNRYYVQQSHRFFDDANRAYYSGIPPEGHILYWASFYNTTWQKVTERPVELPLIQSTHGEVTHARNEAGVDK
ncbi:PKD domain-containing protein [Aliikangiella sp. IMCC44653]